MAILNAAFSILLVISTIIYVYYTFKLFKESKISRENGLKPYIILFIDNSETSPSEVFLNISNVGEGPALELKFEITKDITPFEELDRTIKDKGFLSKEFSIYPPKYKLRQYLRSMSSKYEDKNQDFVVIDCSYKDILNNTYSQSFKLEFKNSLGKSKLTPPESYLGMISYQLEKIQKELNILNKPKD